MIKSKKNIAYLQQTFIILAIFIFAIGCKTSKITGTSYPPMNPEELMAATDSSKIEAGILELKFKAKLTDQTGTHRATCYVRMYRDSLMWISIRSMSLEGMRMLMTTDSLKFVDRMNKKYYQGDYGFLNRRLNLNPDFHLLQSMLLQEMYVFNKSYGDNLSQHVKACKDSSHYCLWLNAEKNKDKVELLKPFTPSKVKQYFRFYPDSHRLFETKLLSTLTGESMQISYGRATEGDEMSYPSRIGLRTSGSNGIELELETLKADCCDTVKTPFKISEKYEPVIY